MTVDDHKAIVHRLYDDVFNRGRTALVPELIADDFINHAAAPEVRIGPGGLCKVVISLRAAFPDNRHIIEDMIGEGDQVAVRVTFRGTNIGPYQGMAPTGKHIVQEQLHIFRFRDGKGVEQWAVRDELSMLRQLGVVPMISATRRAGDACTSITVPTPVVGIDSA